MNVKTKPDVSIISIDLAKDVFQVAHADAEGRLLKQERLRGRLKFEQAMCQWQGAVVVMESCATANHWGRILQAQGLTVVLLPAQRVAAYRPRNKTDAADTLALLEAYRHAQIKPVPVKTEVQQSVLTLHTLRELHKAHRVASINALRSHCREYGVVLPLSTEAALKLAASAILELPLMLHSVLQGLLEQIMTLGQQMAALEDKIQACNQQQPENRVLQSIPGIGPLTSSALAASAVSPIHFEDGRQLSAWLGLTPKERSSGNARWQGGITKQGDSYVRTLIIHGARAALNVALTLRKTQPERLSRLQAWAASLFDRAGYNKTTVALASKMIRLAWALWKNNTHYQAQPLNTPIQSITS